MALKQATEPDSLAQALNDEATDYPLPPIKELTAEESRAFFDELTRELLGISGDEFVRRYDAGRYDDILDDEDYVDLLYLSILGGLGQSSVHDGTEMNAMSLRRPEPDAHSAEPKLDLQTETSSPPIPMLTLIEGKEMFDEQARALLAISGDEFVRRYHAGRYDDILDDPEHAALMYLAMLGGLGQ